MSVREQLGLAIAPLLLRAVLGLVFIWFGCALLFPRTVYSPGDALILSGMGLELPRQSAPVNAPSATAPAQRPISQPPPTSAPGTPRLNPPGAPLPLPGQRSGDGSKPTRPESRPSAPPSPRTPAGIATSDAAAPGDAEPVEASIGPGAVLTPAARATTTRSTTTNPARSATPKPGAGTPSPTSAAPSPSAPAGAPTSPQPAAPIVSGPVELRALYRVALLLNSRALVRPHLAQDVELIAPGALWPASLGTGAGALWTSWIVAVGSLFGGCMVLVGLFVRLWSVPLALGASTALWLVHIGPSLWTGRAVLGFIPGYDWTNVSAWSAPLLMLSLAAMSLSLLVLGAGPLSLDALVFAPTQDASKPAKGAREDDE
jgi:uncharacterized membrane protein YphA (DoxX/SURF4 family)